MTDSPDQRFPHFDGHHLKALRQARGLTQRQIADMGFTTVNYLSKLERNLIANPGINLLVKLAAILHCSLDDLVLTSKTPPTATPLQNLLLDRLSQYPPTQAEQLSGLFIATLDQIPPQTTVTKKG